MGPWGLFELGEHLIEVSSSRIRGVDEQGADTDDVGSSVDAAECIDEEAAS